MSGAGAGGGLVFRSGTTADRDAVVGLFELAFGRRLDRQVWDWRFQGNPVGPGNIELAWDGATLAGHYALSPVRLRRRGQTVLAGLSGTTMIHPRYRRTGLFPLLARRTYRRAEDAGCALVIGFPNRNSHRGLVRDLGWTDVHEVPKLAARVADIGPVADDPGITEPGCIDHRFDRLWDDVKDACAISVVRDQRYLQWRFVDNPGCRYRIFACHDQGLLTGYVVTKRYEDELQVVDILCRDADTGVRLVRRAAQAASEQGLPVVSAWLNPGLELHREFERLGFQPGAPVTCFCVLGLGSGHSGDYDYRNWYLTMGDSDVY